MRMLSLGFIASAIAGMALTGCASFAPKPISPDATAEAFEARSLSEAGLKAFLGRNLGYELEEWPKPAWDLSELVLVALYYHPDLDLARAKWAVARAGLVTAGQRPNPVLANALAQYNADASGVSPWTLGISLDIPLETAGKRGYRIDQARQLSEAARFNIADAAWKVRSGVRARLLDLYPSEANIERQVSLQEEEVTLLEKRLAVGLISQPVVTQSRIMLNQLNLALRDAQRQRAEGRAGLAAALGLTVDALRDIDLDQAVRVLDQLPPLDTLPAAEVQRTALTNRADVLAALAEYEASQSSLQLEIAKQYPDIVPSPGYTWDAGAAKYSLGLSLLLPILNQNQGPIAEAKARRAQAAAQFNSLQARAIGEIEQTLAGYRFAAAKLDAAKRAFTAERQNLKAVEQGFTAGRVDRLAWVGAQRGAAAAELAYIGALVEAQRALGLLEDAMQRPIGPGGLTAVSAETNPRTEER
jgi:cobalt-zinc-cadmium efflux system outer membrane protein